MDEWLEAARRRLAESLDTSPAEYGLNAEEIEEVLALARIAAHSSGDRTQAPLATYLVGLAHGRHPERSLAALSAVFTDRSSEAV